MRATSRRFLCGPNCHCLGGGDRPRVFNWSPTAWPNQRLGGNRCRRRVRNGVERCAGAAGFVRRWRWHSGGGSVCAVLFWSRCRDWSRRPVYRPIRTGWGGPAVRCRVDSRRSQGTCVACGRATARWYAENLVRTILADVCTTASPAACHEREYRGSLNDSVHIKMPSLAIVGWCAQR